MSEKKRLTAMSEKVGSIFLLCIKGWRTAPEPARRHQLCRKVYAFMAQTHVCVTNTCRLLATRYASLTPKIFFFLSLGLFFILSFSLRRGDGHIVFVLESNAESMYVARADPDGKRNGRLYMLTRNVFGEPESRRRCSSRVSSLRYWCSFI